MKILLLYKYYLPLIDDLVFYLHKNHIEADSFDIVSWRFFSNSKDKMPLIARILMPLFRIPRIQGLLLILYQRKVILTLASRYNIIDIQFFGQEYDKIIPHLKAFNKVIKITVWGSDFYRVDANRMEIQRTLYKLVNVIQVATERVKKDFIGKFPEYESKVRLAHEGISIFDVIKKLDDPGKISEYRKEFGIPADKITLTCGYNGSKGQQHLKMLGVVTKLDPALKNNIYLLLPMTYGTTAIYLMEIKEQIDKTGLPYKIFTTRMSENGVAKLRLSTDIAINIQVTDSFSASVQEHILAGNVLIVGDWLPYDYLQENDVYHIKTNLDDLPEKLSMCLTTLDICKQMTKNNKEKICNFSSWESSIKDWVSIYHELINEYLYLNPEHPKP